MEKNKTFKIVAIVGLVVAVVGLAIGFAAFSATLNISTFNATTKAGSEEANFSSLVTFQNDAKCTSTSGATATAGTATSHTWSGITVTFANPGDQITCSATVKNASAYTAYIKKATTNEAKITCSGSAQNTDAVCSAITGSFELNNGYVKSTVSSAWGLSINDINMAMDPKTGTAIVSLKIIYSSKGEVPDADVSINIPAIQLTFGTNEN